MKIKSFIFKIYKEKEIVQGIPHATVRVSHRIMTHNITAYLHQYMVVYHCRQSNWSGSADEI